MLEHPLYKVQPFYCDNKLIGFLTIWDLDKFIFLEHFAIKKEHRGKGIGGRVLNEFKNKCDKPIVLEVELPNNSIAIKRIAFYERVGFHYNDYTYFQPSYKKQGVGVELRLMSYPNLLTEKSFELIRKCLYIRVYGV